MASWSVDTQDTLASAKLRLNGLTDLIDGIPIVNSLFGLAIPVPPLVHWTPDVLAGESFADPDQYHGQLTGALFDSLIETPDDWTVLLAQFEHILKTPEKIDGVLSRVVEIGAFSDKEIVNEVSRTFAIEHLDLLSVFDATGFVSIKINHAYWEELTVLGFEAAGIPCIRGVHRDNLNTRCRFDHLLITSLRKQQEHAAKQGFEPGSFATPHFSLGVSFGNGDHLTSHYLSIPIGPIHKGAAIGCLGFMQQIFSAKNYRLADGSAAKSLIWKQQCDEFFSRIVAHSDVVVFIVPSHLRGIHIRGWQGPKTTIVIPSLYVQVLWPSVIAVVAGKLAAIFSESRRVNILVQAGVMSATLGIMVDLMRNTYPDTQIRYFDLGQVLDVATYPTNPIGTWIGQPWVREILERTAAFPISVFE